MSVEDLMVDLVLAINDLFEALEVLRDSNETLTRTHRSLIMFWKRREVRRCRRRKEGRLLRLLESLLPDVPLCDEKELLWKNTIAQLKYLQRKIKKDLHIDCLVRDHVLHEDFVALNAPMRTCG